MGSGDENINPPVSHWRLIVRRLIVVVELVRYFHKKASLFYGAMPFVFQILPVQ